MVSSLQTQWPYAVAADCGGGKSGGGGEGERRERSGGRFACSIGLKVFTDISFPCTRTQALRSSKAVRSIVGGGEGGVRGQRAVGEILLPKDSLELASYHFPIKLFRENLMSVEHLFRI